MTPTPKTSSLRDALIADIAHRLRPVMAQVPQEEFDALVARMVDIELKYQRRAAQLDSRQLTLSDDFPGRQPLT